MKSQDREHESPDGAGSAPFSRAPRRAELTRVGVRSGWLGLLAVVSAVGLVGGPSGRAEDQVANACEGFANFDLNGDGVTEIASLKPLAPAPPEEGNAKGLVVVLVESRLLAPLEGPAAEATALLPVLRRFADDLRDAGWRSRLVEADVYAGERHQDGRTLLALRRFFQTLADASPPLAGAVLVGSFPEAFLVRSYNWRKRTKLTLNNGRPNEREFAQPVPYLRTVPEPVAMRCELVLCDLDGNWEELYVEERERLPSVIGVFPDGVPPRGGICTDFERNGVVFEDFFYVNDGQFDVREVVVRRKNGETGEDEEQVTAIDFVPLDEAVDEECSDADRARGNPLARPDIIVSRVNPRGIALRPKPSVVGTDGAGLLDQAAMPQAVTFVDDKSVPRWISVWERDPVLERRLLRDYFDRNHRYRRGEFASAFKPAAIGHGLADGFPRIKEAHPDWHDFDEPGYRAGTKASLLDMANWLKLPAVLRDLRAHSDPWGSTFGKADVDAITEAAGGRPGVWSKDGASLVPSLRDACKGGKADFALYRTMWENGVLPDVGCLYFHQGCDGISPAHARDRPYNHEDYGYWQGAESLLFYVQGLALVGRAKVFYDEPREFCQSLAAGKTIGEAWARYYELESLAEDVDKVGGGIGRKRSYFWSVLGDWTLRLTPPSVPASQP